MRKLNLRTEQVKERRRRRAISGVIGAVLLFAMIGTVGSSYFLFINNTNNLVNQALTNINNQQVNRIQEIAIINTALVGASSTHIGYYLNNTGGVNINITSSLLIDPSGNIAKCYIYEKSAPTMCANTVAPLQTPSLPLIATVGKSLPPFGSGSNGWVDTGFTYASGTYTLKLTTARGSVFTQTYPPTPVPIASLAVTTQGAGIIQINFNTYFYFNTVVSPSNAANCNPSSSTSCYLQQWASGGILGYTMPSYASQGNKLYGYAVTVQNVDPQKRTIVLDANSILNQFLVPSGSSSSTKNAVWRIDNVVNGYTQTGAFAPIQLLPNQVGGLYFMIEPSANQLPSPGDFAAVFIYLHGTVSSAAYGQNVPFVTTLYS